jgi:uncharacterized membrane protein YkgB
MNWLIKIPIKFGLLKKDLDYHLVRASMVALYFFFGYQRWCDYEAQDLILFLTDGPLIFWMYPVLAVSEWLFGGLLLAGFWNKKLGVLGALGSVFSVLCAVTIIPFMRDGWAASADGSSAMVGDVVFLMKDVVLFAVSFYLFRQDVARVSLSTSYQETLSHGSIAASERVR